MSRTKEAILRQVEVRMRFENEDRTWEQRGVLASFWVEEKECNTGTKLVAVGTPFTLSEGVLALGRSSGAVEVRWNFAGSLQGHYMEVTKG